MSEVKDFLKILRSHLFAVYPDELHNTYTPEAIMKMCEEIASAMPTKKSSMVVDFDDDGEVYFEWKKNGVRRKFDSSSVIEACEKMCYAAPKLTKDDKWKCPMCGCKFNAHF